MAVMAKHQLNNQIWIYRRIVKMLMNYATINLGQVEMIKNLFSDNPNLFG